VDVCILIEEMTEKERCEEEKNLHLHQSIFLSCFQNFAVCPTPPAFTGRGRHPGRCSRQHRPQGT